MKKILLMILFLSFAVGCSNSNVSKKTEKKEEIKIEYNELPEATYKVKYVISEYNYKLFDPVSENGHSVVVKSVFGSDGYVNFDNYSKKTGTLNTTYICDDDDKDTVSDCHINLYYNIATMYKNTNDYLLWKIPEEKYGKRHQFTVKDMNVYYAKYYDFDNQAQILAIMPLEKTDDKGWYQYLEVWISDSEKNYQIKDEIVKKIFENVKEIN